MALLESLTLPMGTVMPDFSLSDPTGVDYSLDSLLGEKGLLIQFTCNHCPYAIAIWPRCIALAKTIAPLGIQTVAINPNINPSYPDDSPEAMQKKQLDWGIPFPYLVDASQTVAKAYQAQCTPDLYLINAAKELVYHGRLDDNWKEASAVKNRELEQACLSLAAGKPITTQQFPSMGCSIKWV